MYVRSTSKKAFTLIELLVVVAVLGILAVLLTPALSQAKARAKTVLCKNNIRQVGLALHQYLATYEAYVPEGINGPDSNTDWRQLLNPYVGRPTIPFYWRDGSDYPKPLPPFSCPVFSEGMRDMPFDAGYPPQYYYNAWGTISEAHFEIKNGVVSVSRPLGLGGGGFVADSDGNVLVPPYGFQVKESDVASPSEMLAFGDPFSRSEAPEYDGFFNFPGFQPIPKTFSHQSMYPSNSRWNQNAVRVHGARFNRFYSDGHVEAENFRSQFTATDDYLARWNIDHQPHREGWLRW